MALGNSRKIYFIYFFSIFQIWYLSTIEGLKFYFRSYLGELNIFVGAYDSRVWGDLSNPSTEISYSLPSASNIKLFVYNSLGQTTMFLKRNLRTLEIITWRSPRNHNLHRLQTHTLIILKSLKYAAISYIWGFFLNIRMKIVFQVYHSGSYKTAIDVINE